MSYICRVRNPDGSFNDQLSLVKLERTTKFNEMETARVWVPSPEAQNQTIVEDEDEIQVLDEATLPRWEGVITEVRQRADRHEIVSDGFERYARDAEPIAGTQNYTGTTDDAVVSDAVSSVPQLSTGSINQVNSDTFDVTFYFASQALKIRRMREATGSAYISYNFNKTVDYKNSIGADKTGGVNLSPNNINITDFRVNQSDPEPTPTHIRVIGNDGTYEDVVSSSHSAGDPQIWRRAYYNDLSSSTLLQSTGERLLSELEQDTERIEVTIPGHDDRSEGIVPNLGDRFHIEYPDYDIDQDATVAEVTQIIDSDGTHYEVVFSERDVTFDRDEPREVRSSLKRRYNESEAAGDVRTDVSDSDSLVVEEVEDINFDQNLSVTDDGDQTVTVDASASGGGGVSSLAIPTPTAYFSGPSHGEGNDPFSGAALAPDGRVIFVPDQSTNVGIFDPSDDSYTSGPNHSGVSPAFSGAALAPDGRVIFAPSSSSNVGIFDPSDDSYTSGPSHGEGNDPFSGAALAPDGRVIFAPSNSNNVGIFDPSDDSYTSGPSHGEGDSGAFFGAALAPDGRVIFVPDQSTNVGIFDPSDDSYTSGPSHGESDGGTFFGAALAPDGRVIFAPSSSSNVGIFDPSDDSYTSGPNHSEESPAFSGAALAPDGRVIFAPYQSNNVGIFDPSNDSYTSGPPHGPYNFAFQGAALTPDGRVIFAPLSSDNIGILAQNMDVAIAGSSKR